MMKHHAEQLVKSDKASEDLTALVKLENQMIEN
jgi:hypothetical protein